MGVAEDAEGKQGVFLRKNVIEVAGRALKTNITALAPRILPYSELVNYFLVNLFHWSDPVLLSFKAGRVSSSQGSYTDLSFSCWIQS